MHLPAVRTSGAHIHMRTLKTGTYSHQADGRHRQKDTCALASTRDRILYLLGALLNRVSRAKYCTDSTLTECQQKKRALSNINTVASDAGDPHEDPKHSGIRNVEKGGLNIHYNLVWLHCGEGFRWYICPSLERELVMCYSKGICLWTLNNICELIVTCRQYLSA